MESKNEGSFKWYILLLLAYIAYHDAVIDKTLADTQSIVRNIDNNLAQVTTDIDSLENR